MFKGEFPTEWSMADETLLPKTGDLTNPGNWRPISNTNIYSKILEKLVQRQMSNYIFNNEIISSCQYGLSLDDRLTRQCLRLSKIYTVP